jgi:ACS family D-galactonate transporter-like MFS transporter
VNSTANETAVRPATSARHRVLVMLFITVVLTYLDRSNLSVAAVDLSRDFKLDPVQMGHIFSAFGWAYVALQIPGGWLVDRIGPRRLYAAVCALWSLATILQGCVGGFLFLFSLRLLLGAFEAPAFPICNRLVTTWFPDRERAGAIGFYTSGEFVGLAFLMPVLVLAQKHFGWQSVFVLTGGAGIVWAALWYAIYREPLESRRINAAELDYIRAGGGLVGTTGSRRAGGFSLADIGTVLSRRKLWGIYIGQFAVNSTLWFFLTWFPTYLVKYRHFDFINAGFLASLPFLGAFCGVIASGCLSDWLVRHGVSPTAARKTPIISGLLLSTTIVGANFVESRAWVVFFLTLAFFGNGFASITWVLVSSMASERLLGLTGGVFNFIGNLASIVVPTLIGHLVRGDDFRPALLCVGALALVGALSYIFLVGQVRREE